MTPSNANLRRAADCKVRGSRLHREGRRVDAKRAYLQALALVPDDAAALNNLGVVEVELGQFAEALDTFARLERLRPGDPVPALALGRTLLLAGRVREAIAKIESAAALDPGRADAFHLLGIAHARDGDADGAMAAYRGALQRRPDHSAALSNLVDLCIERNQFAAARDAIDAVLARFPGHPDATYKKAYLLALMCEFESARRLTLEVLRVHPTYAPAHSNLGAIASWQNDYAGAIRHFTEALHHQPGFLDAESGLAHALLATGDDARGWRHYEARPAGILGAKRHAGWPGRVWEGEARPDQALVVYGEAGLGDVLQFCRLVPLARKRVGRLVLYLQPYFVPLARLLQSLEGVDAIATTPDAIAGCELHVSVMSLPHLCGATLGRAPTPVPYLAIDDAALAAWRRKVGSDGNFRVGVVWSGSPRAGNVDANTIDRRRSIRLAMLAPLFDVPGVDWYSLQKGEASAELAHVPFASRIIDWTADLHDFTDTGALAAQMDLVVSVDTSVLHLACALARPTWLCNRFDSCWRWGISRTDAAWYPTLRIFRQRAFGDWSPVIADVAASLAVAAASRDALRAGAQAP